MVELGMKSTVMTAALGLLLIAAILPFAPMGHFAVIPVTAAIAGAVFLLWHATHLTDPEPPPPTLKLTGSNVKKID